jgi:hypothetical protein
MSKSGWFGPGVITCLAFSCNGLPTGASAGGTRTMLPPLIHSAGSGLWSAPATWEGGRVPPAGARVQIRQGHVVRYDRDADQAIRSIHVAGTLTFAPDRDTRLDVGLIKIQPGSDASENGFDCDAHLPVLASGHLRPALEVGTAGRPVQAGHTARIRLVPFAGMDPQSCPAIVCCGGRMEFHGAPLSRSWVKLGATARPGDTRVVLSEPVSGWRVGDHIIVTATQRVETGGENATFRALPHVEEGDSGKPAAGQTVGAGPLIAAREAGLLTQVAAKFALGLRGRDRPVKEAASGEPDAGAWVAARTGLWAAETAVQRHAPGKGAAVVAVLAARTALQAADVAAARSASPSTSAEAAVAAARAALVTAEAALARNASDREAASDGIAAARAALAAAEAAGTPTAPEREAATKDSLLQLLRGFGERRSLPAFTEERTIRAIDGTSLTLDRSLEYAHVGDGRYRGEVANLSRNVIVESAEPDGPRGHTMYHRGSAGSISYAEFRHLGKEGVLGRYSLHFHLVGNSMRGSSVVGASIWDSRNRWLTIHGTNYLVVRDCVGYQSVGHGFYLEDGSEVNNVLDRNLAVQAYRGEPLPRQNLPFDANEGSGFWWANSRNSFTRNVACECDQYGYRFEATPTEGFDLRRPVQRPDGGVARTDIRTLPFVRFDANEAHSLLYGLNLGEGVDNVGPDSRHPFVIRNTLLWNAQWAFRPNAPSMLVDGMEIYDCRYGIFQPIYDRHAFHGLVLRQTENLGGDGIVPIGRRPDGLEFPIAMPGKPVTVRVAFDKGSAAGVDPKRFDPGAEATGKGGKGAPEPGGYRVEQKKGLPVGGPTLGYGTVKRGIDNPLEVESYGRSSCGPLASTGFPRPLAPVDDLPPATVITAAEPLGHGRVRVRGTTTDNGTVRRVLVNGREARSLAPNFAEWEISLANAPRAELQLTAWAEDAAGNKEKLPHVVGVGTGGLFPR